MMGWGKLMNRDEAMEYIVRSARAGLLAGITGMTMSLCGTFQMEPGWPRTVAVVMGMIAVIFGFLWFGKAGVLVHCLSRSRMGMSGKHYQESVWLDPTCWTE
jgi:hypothetical protein